MRAHQPGGDHLPRRRNALQQGRRDDLAAATAKIPSKSCEKPDRPRCEPGENEMRTESGACVCKTGFIRDDNHRCVGIIEPARCPDGTPVPKNGRCPRLSRCAIRVPRDAQRRRPLRVQTGYERDDRGRCVEKEAPLCEPGRNEYRDDDDHCVCKRGFERDEKGRCVEKPNRSVSRGRTSIATTTASASARRATSATRIMAAASDKAALSAGPERVSGRERQVRLPARL